MTEEQNAAQEQPAGPVISEFKGKPVIRLPLVEHPEPDTSWHWLTFGKSKAKAIIKFYDAIKKFAGE